MTSILSTGKKKQKASRVFGGEVFQDIEVSSSLSYSPSPAPRIMKSNTDANPSPTILFEKELEHPTPKTSGSLVENKENANENSENKTKKIPIEKKPGIQTFRSSELTRLRASAMSPMRQNLVQKTQEAINNATSAVSKSLNAKSSLKNGLPSVNHAINASKAAKENKLKERSKQTKSVRFKRDEEKADAKTFYHRVEENRRQLLAVQRRLASAHFKDKAQTNYEKKREYIDKLDQESLFNSEVFREHKKKLKEERDTRRKISMDARAKLRQNNREGEQKMMHKEQKEKEAIFDIRYDLHRAKMEAQKAQNDGRRKSFQFRSGDAKRIRDIRLQWRQEEITKEHQSFELTRAAAKDVEAHQKKMDAERRDSFKSRNLHSRKQALEEQERANAALIAQQESYELKRAAERDVDEYRKKMHEERRKSLAARNKESARHAKVMEELRVLALEQEAESFTLKWAGENDAKAYIAKLAEERRKSLQLRGEETKRIQKYEEEQYQLAVEKALEEGKLQSENQRDVENYKKECAENRRKSLQYRGKQHKVQKLEEENQRQKEQDVDHQNFELESLARKDIEEYVKDCKNRRRKSLAFRAKEKRRHAEWRQQQREQEIEEQSRTAYYHSLDAKNAVIAQQEERARMALDALRNAGCSIKGNPFSDLLGSISL